MKTKNQNWAIQRNILMPAKGEKESERERGDKTEQERGGQREREGERSCEKERERLKIETKRRWTILTNLSNSSHSVFEPSQV